MVVMMRTPEIFDLRHSTKYSYLGTGSDYINFKSKDYRLIDEHDVSSAVEAKVVFGLHF